MTNGLSGPRKQFLDVLRVLATCAVVLMHVLTGATDVTDASIVPEYRSLLLSVMDLVTWCVPIFLLIVRCSVSGGPDSNAVDFHATIQFDDETLSAIDHFGIYQICALGIDFDDHIRCLYLKTAGIVDIGHHEGGGFTGSGIETLVEDLHAVIGYTAAGKNGLYFIFI